MKKKLYFAICIKQFRDVSLTHDRMQESILSWGQLLIALGGSYKPPKCFYYLISFGWKANGDWYYEANHEIEEYNVVVPMPDGSFAPIDHLPVDTPNETLGVFTCPTGAVDGALARMKEKCQKWVDRAKEGAVKRRDVWFLVDKQFHRKQPSPKAYRLWCQAVRQIVPAEGITDHLGPFLHNDYKIWE
jgi:hypothetical protein